MRSSKIIKALFTFALLMSAFMASTGVARAQTATGWYSNGTALVEGVAASGGTTTLAINASGGTVGVTCTSSSASNGDLQGRLGPTGPVSPPWPTWDVLTGLTLTFNTCTAAGFAANVTCSGTSTLTAVSYTPDVVSGYIKTVNCVIKTPSFPSCTITVVGTGTGGKAVNGTYNNATGVLAIVPSGQTLTATWSACPFINPSTGNAPAVFNGTYTVTTNPRPCVRYGTYSTPNPPYPACP